MCVDVTAVWMRVHECSADVRVCVAVRGCVCACEYVWTV